MVDLGAGGELLSVQVAFRHEASEVLRDHAAHLLPVLMRDTWQP